MFFGMGFDYFWGTVKGSLGYLVRAVKYAYAKDDAIDGYRLFLDDERHPPNDGKRWVVLRNSKSCKDFVLEYGMPKFISFDHDLGGEDTAMVFLDWMIDAVLDGEVIFPSDFAFEVHSQNPIGAENLRGKLMSFIAHLQKIGYEGGV